MTEAQVAEAVAMAETQGIPTSVTIFVGAKTIRENGAAFQDGKAADGKGIDHYFVAYGDASSRSCSQSQGRRNERGPGAA